MQYCYDTGGLSMHALGRFYWTSKQWYACKHLVCLAGEAVRLQQLEVQLLGETSTGYKNNEAAQQSPGDCAAFSIGHTCGMIVSPLLPPQVKT